MRQKALDMFKHLRHVIRAILSVLPKCSHRCVSLKESPLKPVLLLKHATRISTEQTSVRMKWFKHIAILNFSGASPLPLLWVLWLKLQVAPASPFPTPEFFPQLQFHAARHAGANNNPLEIPLLWGSGNHQMVGWGSKSCLCMFFGPIFDLMCFGVGCCYFAPHYPACCEGVGKKGSWAEGGCLWEVIQEPCP